MDILGPMSTIYLGNNNIVTNKDLQTKYLITVPLRQVTSEETADAFVKNFICKFGSLEGILGANFLSQLMKAIERKFRFGHYQTGAYHPQYNGSIGTFTPCAFRIDETHHKR